MREATPGWIFPLVPFLLLLGTETSAVELRFTIRAPGELPEGVLVLQPTSANSAHKEIRLPLRNSMAVELASGRVWKASVESARYWADDTSFLVTPEPRPISLTLLPKSTLQGKLLPEDERSHELPTIVRLRLQPAVTEAAPFDERSFECPVADSRWSCDVPAGNWDLRLRARGFVSHHFWSIQAAPHKVKDLGPQRLKAGASIVGWVQPAEAIPGFRFADCTVEVQAKSTAIPHTPTEEQRRARAHFHSKVNQHGFFSVDGLVPGNYRVVARHPQFAPTPFSPVEVLAGSETEIRLLELQKPVTFEVRVHHHQTPFRTPWRVELSRHSPVPGHLDPVEQGVTSEDGSFRVEDLPPGRYSFAILDNRGSRWAYESVELEPDSPTVEVRLPFQRLEGLLTLGDQPIAARLDFGGRSAARRIGIRSDEEGKFYVFLPLRKNWDIDVTAPELDLRARLEDVEIPRKKASDRWAKVELSLPDTVLEGVVVDPGGKPVQGANLFLNRVDDKGWMDTQPTAADGTFKVRALPKGLWTVQGTARREERHLAGITQPFSISAESDAHIRLILRENAPLSGIILGPHGQGLPGARIIGILEQPHGSFWSNPLSAVSDVDGVFEMNIPTSAEAIQLTVLAIGFAATQLRLPTTTAEPVVIHPPQGGGTIILLYGDDLVQLPGARRMQTVLFREGMMVAHAPALYRWAQAHGIEQPLGDRFNIPMMEPGRYVACLQPSQGMLRGLPPSESDREHCASGYLPPNGELTLQLPD